MATTATATGRRWTTRGATPPIRYVYDDAGRLQTVNDWDSLLTTYFFDKGVRLASVMIPNGIVSTYSYDDTRRLTGLSHVQGGRTYAFCGYTYDPVGNRLTASKMVRQRSGGVSKSIGCSYDPPYRLTAADYNGGTTYFHYTYDAVCNRQTEVTQSGTTTYGYDIANRLTSVDSQALTWDNNGNLLSDGVSTYTYDHANRLAAGAKGSDTYAFDYNGLGDRLRQTVNGTPTNYTLDLVAGLTQVLSDGSNVVPLRRVAHWGGAARRLAVPFWRCAGECPATRELHSRRDFGEELRAVWGHAHERRIGCNGLAVRGRAA